MEQAHQPVSGVPAAVPLPPRSAHTLGTLLRLLERTHRGARVHAASVSLLAVGAGARLGLAADALRELELAATVHDLGKLRVSARILEKPSALSRSEWHAVRAHPVEGERLLRPLLTRSAVLAAVRSHHERWDGRGYPDGLAATAAPLAARIVCVADAFAAMVEHRPYRPPRSAEAALAELERHAGSQFDPECVAALASTVTHRFPAAGNGWQAAANG